MTGRRLTLASGADHRFIGRFSNAAAVAVAVIAAAMAVTFVADAHTKLTAAGQAPFVDWRTYALAAGRFMSGEPLYAPAQLAGEYLMPRVVSIGYSYPPPSVLVFLPFQTAPVGLVAWLALNVVALVSGVAAMLRRDLRIGWPWAIAVTSLSLAVFYPFAQGVAVGNVNVGLAGMLAWYWVAGDRRWTGVAAGLGALLKVIPGLYALWAARYRGARPVVSAGATVVVVTLITLPLFDVGVWSDFLRALANQRPTCWNGTVSIACVADPYVGGQLAKTIGVIVALLLAGGVLLVRSRFVAFGLLSLAVLAPVTDGWAHYWLFVYVAIVAGIGHVWTARLARRSAQRFSGEPLAAL